MNYSENKNYFGVSPTYNVKVTATKLSPVVYPKLNNWQLAFKVTVKTLATKERA